MKREFITKKEVYEIIRNHKLDGGSTFSFSNGNMENTPYYSVPLNLVNLEIKGKDIKFEDLKKFILDNKDLFGGNKNLGTYYDSKNDISHIEVISLIEDLEDAKKLGLKHNSESIYDLKNKKTIYLSKKIKEEITKQLKELLG